VGSVAQTVTDPALVLPGQALVDALLDKLLTDCSDRVILDEGAAETEGAPTVPSPKRVDWVVAAGGAAANSAPRRRWGERQIIATECRLRSDADIGVSRIETTPEGWMFLAPTGPGVGMLQAMVAFSSLGSSDVLRGMLRETEEIRNLVRGELGTVRDFAAAPSMAETVCAPGWIAVGEEAMRLDPVCGDGVGHAIREAILAAAVIDGVSGGLSEDQALSHYRARLLTAFKSHLHACLRFYDSAGFGRAWDADRAETKRAIHYLDQQLAEWSGFTLAVKGFALMPTGSNALSPL
jgi:hypothetical protein